MTKSNTKSPNELENETTWKRETAKSFDCFFSRLPQITRGACAIQSVDLRICEISEISFFEIRGSNFHLRTIFFSFFLLFHHFCEYSFTATVK